MYNYKAVLQYDGSRYDGWQRMGGDSSSNTIEVKISEIIKKMTGEQPDIYVGCRTEKGVHALGQVINFKLNSEHKDYDIRNYLNRYLPRDIAVIGVEAVDERFHSQLNAKAKTYEYRLDTGNVADVFKRKYCYHTFEKPDVEAMRKAAKSFEGKHDFKLFTTAKRSKSTIKNIEAVSIEERDNQVVISVTASDFLHNMARYMIGMLLDVGNGLRSPETVQAALDCKDITMSIPAESYGLFLKEIRY
ncbi:MAG: tRNA pseudouridine(38-40) synthase TruA [Eubacteriales bacterium]|nr:tRNA pseudouridine(38-40) synthase TruA [Eubacteriales bacterium]